MSTAVKNISVLLACPLLEEVSNGSCIGLSPLMMPATSSWHQGLVTRVGGSQKPANAPRVRLRGCDFGIQAWGRSLSERPGTHSTLATHHSFQRRLAAPSLAQCALRKSLLQLCGDVEFNRGPSLRVALWNACGLAQGKRIALEKMLTRTVLLAERAAQSLFCPVCHKALYNRSSAITHLTAVHKLQANQAASVTRKAVVAPPSGQMILCQDCQFQTVEREAYADHMTKSHPETVVDKRKLVIDALTDHTEVPPSPPKVPRLEVPASVSRLHGSIFRCVDCGKEYTVQRHFDAHKCPNAGGVASPSPPECPTPQKRPICAHVDGKYQCPYCEKQHHALWLVRHARSVHPDKPLPLAEEQRVKACRNRKE